MLASPLVGSTIIIALLNLFKRWFMGYLAWTSAESRSESRQLRRKLYQFMSSCKSKISLINQLRSFAFYWSLLIYNLSSRSPCDEANNAHHLRALFTSLYWRCYELLHFSTRVLSMRIKIRSEKASASSTDGELLPRCFRIIQLRLICSCLFCIASGSRHCSVIYLEKSIKIPQEKASRRLMTRTIIHVRSR